MSCYFPWYKAGATYKRPLACGQCHGCKLEYARQWAVRCMHEASLSDDNCFLTLTFKETFWSLDYSYFQLFMKRLRERFRGKRIRFFMSGEYGEDNSRPHFHALLFGFNFPDREYFKMSPSGSKLYRSKILEELWPLGYSSIGDVTFESAGYVARYAVKKVGGNDTNEILDPDTGEVFRRTPAFVRMSLKPVRKGDRGGIGAEWIKRFFSDVYPHGKVVVNGQECRAPRYYDQIFRSRDAGGYMILVGERLESQEKYFAETLPARLEARAAVAKAKAALSRRKL